MQESSWSQSSGAELTDVWPLEGHLPWHKHVAKWCKMLTLKNVENALGAPFRYTEIVIQSGDFFMSLVRAIYRWKSRQIMFGYGYMHIWYMATYIFICNMYRYILTHVTTMAFVNEYIYIQTVSLSCGTSQTLLNNTSSIFNQTIQHKKQQLPIDIFHSEHLAVQQGQTKNASRKQEMIVGDARHEIYQQ